MSKRKGCFTLIITVLCLLLPLCSCGGKAPEQPPVPPPEAAAELAPAPEPVAEAASTPETEQIPPPSSEPKAESEAATPALQQIEPAPEQAAKQEQGEYICILSVRCDTILNNMDALNPEKLELVPLDGVIFPAAEVVFYEGESVFNVLQRELKRAGIHMEFVNTPLYDSAYIKGINNIYEFDAGELSGWMYKVNGTFPNYGCSRYMLADGDMVEWLYTCDLGMDIGGGDAPGGQKEADD